jgi:hypothetical protein
MLQFSLGGILQGLHLKVQFMNSVISWVFGTSMWNNGGVSCYMWDTLILCVKLFNHFHDSNIWFVFFWKCLQKFNSEELVDMSTCNLFQTVHNIWLQKFGKNVKCLFVVTFDDYVRAFIQNASYRVYLNGGRCKEGLARDELRLWRRS